MGFGGCGGSGGTWARGAGGRCEGASSPPAHPAHCQIPARMRRLARPFPRPRAGSRRRPNQGHPTGVCHSIAKTRLSGIPKVGRTWDDLRKGQGTRVGEPRATPARPCPPTKCSTREARRGTWPGGSLCPRWAAHSPQSPGHMPGPATGSLGLVGWRVHCHPGCRLVSQLLAQEREGPTEAGQV